MSRYLKYGAAALVVLLVAFVFLFIGGTSYKGGVAYACSQQALYLNPATGTTVGTSGRFNEPEQRASAATIKGVGITRKLGTDSILTAYLAAGAESEFRNVPAGKGDRDSIGLFQMRPSIRNADGSYYWGSPEQLADPVYAANRFYDELLKIENRDQKSIVTVAIEVERPGSRQYYENFFRENEAELRRLMGDTSELDTIGAGNTSVALPLEACANAGDADVNAINVVIQAALSMQGKPYKFGNSIPSSSDGSEFTRWAYAKAGVKLPLGAAAQKAFGAAVSPGTAKSGPDRWNSVIKPGDLLYWSPVGSPTLVNHVALFVGNGQIIDAASPLELISLKPIPWERDGSYVSAVTRPPLPSGLTSLADGWVKPLKSITVTSKFGMRWHPTQKVWMLHDGVDFAASLNTPVYAAHDGVLVTPFGTGFGNQVMINHGDGVLSGYAHLNKFVPGLDVGDTVEAGQVIGYAGTTGWSTGVHLHFRILINRKAVEPIDYLRTHGLVL